MRRAGIDLRAAGGHAALRRLAAGVGSDDQRPLPARRPAEHRRRAPTANVENDVATARPELDIHDAGEGSSTHEISRKFRKVRIYERGGGRALFNPLLCDHHDRVVFNIYRSQRGPVPSSPVHPPITRSRHVAAVRPLP